MANNLYAVIGTEMLVQQIDKRFTLNGMFHLFVDGVQIAGAQDVSHHAIQPTLNPLVIDARVGTELELRSAGNEYQLVSAKLSTLQANVLARVNGMGTALRDKAATNTARTVGTPAAVPVAVSGALFFLVPYTGVGPNITFTIPRTILTDLKQVAPMVTLYNATNNACSDVTTAPYNATVTVTDYHIGRIVVSAIDVLASGDTGVYDPSVAYTVRLATGRVAVDYIDPSIKSGDNFMIVGVGFDWGELANAGDYSLFRPETEIVPVALDLVEALSDTPDGKQWHRLRFFHAEQVNNPDSVRDTSGNPNGTEYRWRCKKPGLRLGGASASYEEDFIILP